MLDYICKIIPVSFCFVPEKPEVLEKLDFLFFFFFFLKMNYLFPDV